MIVLIALSEESQREREREENTHKKAWAHTAGWCPPVSQKERTDRKLAR